jgi:predicted PurR-regulated permease PerM
LRAKIARAVLMGLSVVSVALLAMLLYPLASALLFAAVLAGGFLPVVNRLSRAVGERRSLAAGVTTGAVALLIVLPVCVLVVVLGREAIDAVAYVRDIMRSGDVAAFVDRLPAPIRFLAETVNVPRDRQGVQELAEAQSGRAAAAVGGVLLATSSFLVQVGLMLVAFYFFLVDGAPLVRWLADVAPIGRDRTYELLSDFRAVSEALLFSSLATAGVQSAVALLGFLLTGVPQPFFFALVTFIMAFVPVLGAASVSVCLAVLLYLTGHPTQALALASWGIVVVGMSDNLVKPLVMRGRMEVHGAVIFFALVGGLAAFGPAGVAAGPLIVSFFLAIVRMCRRDVADAEREGAAPPGLKRRSA